MQGGAVMLELDRIICGDCLEVLKTLPTESVDCCITSPPYYGLRDYGIGGQIGLEPTPEAYVARLVEVFREVGRVLKPEGTLWLNLGDSYCGYKGDNYGRTKGNLPTHCTSVLEIGKRLDTGTPQTSGLKPKDLIGIPWMVAFALRADGWYLRSDIIWHKPNCMPESVTDRPTKSHEYLFLLSKSQRYYYDAEAIKEDASASSGGYQNRWKRGLPMRKETSKSFGSDEHGQGLDGVVAFSGNRNKRTVWTIPTKPFNGSKFGCDYVGSDGKPYIASPDCPFHGHLATHRNQQTALCGELLDQNGSHISDKCDHPGSMLSLSPVSMLSMTNDMQTQPSSTLRILQNTNESKTRYQTAKLPSDDLSASDESLYHTTHNLEPSTRQADNLGCSPSGSSPIAILHNKKNRKMGRVPATSSSCNSCEGISGHIGRTQAQLSCCGEDPGISESTLSEDCVLSAKAIDPSGQILPRIVDKHIQASTLKCVCKVYKVDHFAVMPEALVAPCILAGTSEKGYCPDCGKPWVRQVDRGDIPMTERRMKLSATQRAGHPDYTEKVRPSSLGAGAGGDVPNRVIKTIGWLPSCQCASEPRPGIVLDPFSGAGTVALVAKKLGRHYIGIELNPDYIQMAKARVSKIPVSLSRWEEDARQ